MKKLAADFARDFRTSPVPIRMSCRFSNGITLNYYARAVTCTDRMLRAISVNPFERGIQLVIAAPLGDGIVRCRVVGITRSKRHASCFEVDLRFIDSPTPLLLEDAASAPCLADAPLLVDDIMAAASGLGSALEASIGIPFATAFAQARLHDRHPAILAAIAATFLVLEEKGFAKCNLALQAAQRNSGNGHESFTPKPEMDFEKLKQVI